MREQANNPLKSAFDETLELLFREEQKLRFQSEQQVRAYARLMFELARELVPGELDRRQHADPNFILGLGPEEWRKVLQDALAGNATGKRCPELVEGWNNQPDAQALAQSQAALAKARETIHALEGQIGILQATLNEKPLPAAERTERPQVELEEDVAVVEATGTAQLEQSLALTIPTIPAHPPAVCKDVLSKDVFNDVKQWKRVATALVALALTGWSVRLGIVMLIASQLGIIASSGTMKRVMKTLAELKLWEVKSVNIASKTVNSIILVRLAGDGKKVAQAIGVTPVQSEWDVLERKHSGLRRIGLVCAFAYHARLHKYAAEVCPSVPRPVAPDVALRQGNETLYVGVETDSGDTEHRLDKWRSQSELQSSVAIATLTPEMQAQLVNEARSAGAKHGKATNLQYLFASQKKHSPLWALEW